MSYLVKIPESDCFIDFKCLFSDGGELSAVSYIPNNHAIISMIVRLLPTFWYKIVYLSFCLLLINVLFKKK